MTPIHETIDRLGDSVGDITVALSELSVDLDEPHKAKVTALAKSLDKVADELCGLFFVAQRMDDEYGAKLLSLAERKGFLE